MELAQILSLIVCIVLPLGSAFIGTLFGNGGESEWYKELRKPSWTPPNWAFPVVWTILYVLMGVASWLIWKDGGFRRHGTPLAIYLLQLLLNLCWTPIFFGLHLIGLALVEIVVLWFCIVATIVSFWPINRIAASLLTPYIIWVTIAVSLNLVIWLDNQPQTYLQQSPGDYKSE